MTPPPACPRCKSPMVAKSGRFGAYFQCSKAPACRGKLNGGSDVPGSARAPGPPPMLGVPPGAGPLPFGTVREFGPLDLHQQVVADWRRGTAVVAAAAG